MTEEIPENPLNIKYIYGTKRRLGKVLKPGGKFRFRDSRFYKNHENDLIKDDECNRVFSYDPKKIGSVTIKDEVIPGSEIAELIISVPVQVCHLLCLSNTPNSPELFERFKADLCLEVDVGRLIDIMETFFASAGPRVSHRQVKYYASPSDLEGTDPETLVFHKDNRFSIEDEYRVAVFWPFNDKTILTNKSGRLEIFGKSVKKLLEVGFIEPEGIRTVVIQAKDKKGKILFNRPE